jgi:hypothetical protein
LQGQRLGEGALLLPGKHVVEIVAGAQRPVQILAVRRRFGKARVVVSDKSRERGVAFRQGGRAGQPQFLEQPVLQSPVGMLDATFGRARIGGDDVDVSPCNARLNWVMPSVPLFIRSPPQAIYGKRDPRRGRTGEIGETRCGRIAECAARLQSAVAARGHRS